MTLIRESSSVHNAKSVVDSMPIERCLIPIAEYVAIDFAALPPFPKIERMLVNPLPLSSKQLDSPKCWDILPCGDTEGTIRLSNQEGCRDCRSMRSWGLFEGTFPSVRSQRVHSPRGHRYLARNNCVTAALSP